MNRLFLFRIHDQLYVLCVQLSILVYLLDGKESFKRRIKLKWKIPKAKPYLEYILFFQLGISSQSDSRSPAWPQYLAGNWCHENQYGVIKYNYQLQAVSFNKTNLLVSQICLQGHLKLTEMRELSEQSPRIKYLKYPFKCPTTWAETFLI